MNNRKMTRTGAIALIMVALLIATSVFVSAQVSTQTTVLRSASVTGELAQQYSQHWLGVTTDQPSANLRFTMTFYPSDNSVVRNNFGFWVLDDNDVKAVVQSGGRFPDNNVAAGERTARDPQGQLSAQITANGFSNYTVVVFNDTEIPVEYTLTVENGKLVDDAGQVKDASGEDMSVTETATTITTTTTTTTAAAPVATAGAAAKTDATTYTVVSGDTLGSIANATYGNVAYYKALCTFNELTNCNLLEVGQELQLPAVSVLDALDGTAAATRTTAATTATATTPVTATVATTDTVTVTETAVVTATETTTATVTTTTATPTTRPVAPTVAGEVNTYVVVAGDTLGIIARDAYGDLQLFTQLCAYNKIADCNVIEVGQEILLPDLATLKAI